MTATSECKDAKRSTACVDYVLPPVSIREEKEAYVLEADMAGVNKDSLEIKLEGFELALVGRRTDASAAAAGNVLLREQRRADYRRVFDLDPSINTAAIRAHMRQGLLTLTLPKSEAVKPRKIVVNG